MPGKYDHIDFKPPKSVADAAAKGLNLRKNNKGKGGLSSGQAKKEGVGSGVQRATNLKNRDTMSPATVKRMKAFFDRHEGSKKIDKGETYATDEGYIAWMLWGGDPGRSWANKVVKQMEAADKKSKQASSYAWKLNKAASPDNHKDYMFDQNWRKIHRQVMELEDFVTDFVDNGGRIEDWLEDKVSKVADDMDEIYSYVKDQSQTKYANALPGGLGDNLSPTDVDQEQLAKGIKVEMEHTNDPNLAEEIALDHLAEDPAYYDKLETIEPQHADKAYDEQAQGPGPDAPGGHYGYALDNAVAARRYSKKLKIT